MKAVLKLQFEPEKAKFVPGEILNGTVLIESEAQWDAEYGELALRWIAQNDINMDESIVQGKRLMENASIPPNKTYPFSLTLPVAPWIYDGRLFRIRWVISALFRPRNEFPMKTEREIVILPANKNTGENIASSFDSHNQGET